MKRRTVMTRRPKISIVKSEAAEKHNRQSICAALQSKKNLIFIASSDDDKDMGRSAGSDDEACIYWKDLSSYSKSRDKWIKYLKCSKWEHREYIGIALCEKKKKTICDVRK